MQAACLPAPSLHCCDMQCAIFQAEYSSHLPYCQQCRKKKNRNAGEREGLFGVLPGWVECHHRQARPKINQHVLRFCNATWGRKCLRLASGGPRWTVGKLAMPILQKLRKLWISAWTSTCHTTPSSILGTRPSPLSVKAWTVRTCLFRETRQCPCCSSLRVKTSGLSSLQKYFASGLGSMGYLFFSP